MEDLASGFSMLTWAWTWAWACMGCFFFLSTSSSSPLLCSFFPFQLIGLI